MFDSYSEALDAKFPEPIPIKSKEVSSVKGRAYKALKRGREMIEAIENARLANKKDPTQNDIGSKANTYRYAKKKTEEMQQVFSKTEDDLREISKMIDQEINTPISEAAANGPFANEARNHVKSLSPKRERANFVRVAINEGDYETVECVLGAPAYLSGLDNETYEQLREQYKRERFGKEIKTRDALIKIQDTIGKAYNAASESIDKRLKSPEVLRAIKRQDASRKAMEN